MKKIGLLMLAILFSVASFAQEEKSSPTMWLGGTVNYTSTGGNSGWLLGPTFGMMLNENMAVGGTLTLQDGGAWEVAPYFRYYMPVTDNFAFYGDGVVAIGGYDQGGNEFSTFGVFVAPGFQYWFTPQWSMASTIGKVGYSSLNNKTADSSEGTFELGVDFANVNFSFFWHF